MLNKEFKVTKEQVEAYEQVRQSGVTNMWAVDVVCDYAADMIDKDDCLYIMENYSELISAYDINRG
jgi:hypothetical protein